MEPFTWRLLNQIHLRAVKDRSCDLLVVVAILGFLLAGCWYSTVAHKGTFGQQRTERMRILTGLCSLGVGGICRVWTRHICGEVGAVCAILLLVERDSKLLH